MPENIHKHVEYTRRELNEYPYYRDMFNFLADKKIETFLDLGSNSGEYAKILFEKFQHLKQGYLIEGDDDNYAFSMSHLEGYSITAFNVIINYEEHNVSFYKSPEHVGIHRLVSSSENTVPNFTLESLNIPVVDFAKLDIEGAEYSVLKKSDYIKRVKFLDIEFHSPMTINSLDFIRETLPMYDVAVSGDSRGGNYLLQRIDDI